jgi:hypothetical protein
MNKALQKWIRNQKTESEKIIIDKLRDTLPNHILTDQELLEIHTASISIFQSRKSKSGKGFETLIEDQLSRADIPFISQVAINKCGIILGTGRNKDEDHAHTLDILIGASAIDEIKGEHIRKYIVLSCKKSSRERWNQDAWTLEHKPRLYLYCTIFKDYPPSKKFQESESRKIATSTPKKMRDDRKYKLDLDQSWLSAIRECL